MLISHDHNFVVLSNTKCGSTSLVHSLESHVDIAFTVDHRLRHTPFKAYEAHLKPYLRGQWGAGVDSFDVFCVFREPLDWLGSWYRFRCRNELADPKHPKHAEYAGHLSWEDFLRSVIYTPMRDRSPCIRIERQSTFVSSQAGGPKGITLFRYDDLPQLISLLLGRMGKEIDILNWNVSPKIPLQTPASLEKEVRNVLKDEFAIYDQIRPGGTRF